MRLANKDLEAYHIVTELFEQTLYKYGGRVRYGYRKRSKKPVVIKKLSAASDSEATFSETESDVEMSGRGSSSIYASSSTSLANAATAASMYNASMTPSYAAAANAAPSASFSASSQTSNFRSPSPAHQQYQQYSDGTSQPTDVLDADMARILTNLQHAKQFEVPEISELELVGLIERLLMHHGSVPVGKMGSLLHTVVNNHSLPAMLKERYGGLKKFLERHPSIFRIGVDHPFNPHVHLLHPSQSLVHSHSHPSSLTLQQHPQPSAGRMGKGLQGMNMGMGMGVGSVGMGVSSVGMGAGMGVGGSAGGMGGGNAWGNSGDFKRGSAPSTPQHSGMRGPGPIKTQLAAPSGRHASNKLTSPTYLNQPDAPSSFLPPGGGGGQGNMNMSHGSRRDREARRRPSSNASNSGTSVNMNPSGSNVPSSGTFGGGMYPQHDFVSATSSGQQVKLSSGNLSPPSFGQSSLPNVNPLPLGPGTASNPYAQHFGFVGADANLPQQQQQPPPPRPQQQPQAHQSYLYPKF